MYSILFDVKHQLEKMIGKVPMGGYKLPLDIIPCCYGCDIREGYVGEKDRVIYKFIPTNSQEKEVSESLKHKREEIIGVFKNFHPEDNVFIPRHIINTHDIVEIWKKEFWEEVKGVLRSMRKIHFHPLPTNTPRAAKNPFYIFEVYHTPLTLTYDSEQVTLIFSPDSVLVSIKRLFPFHNTTIVREVIPKFKDI